MNRQIGRHVIFEHHLFEMRSMVPDRHSHSDLGMGRRAVGAELTSGCKFGSFRRDQISCNKINRQGQCERDELAAHRGNTGQNKTRNDETEEK